MRSLLGLNAALALLLELALLVAVAAIGLLVPVPVAARVAVAVVLVGAVVVVWVLLLAPRSTHRLAPGGRLLTQAVLFALAVFGLAAVGGVGWALALAVLAAVRLVLGARLGRV